MNLAKIMLILTALGVSFTGGQFYMGYKTYKEKVDTQKNYDELKEFEEDLKKISIISENFDPEFDIIIDDFDFTLNMNINENNQYADLSSSIWGYKSGEFKLTDNNDGRAILKLITHKLDQFINNGYNDDVVIKVGATGTADGLKVKSNTKYNGAFGEKIIIKYFNVDNPKKEFVVLLEAGKTNMRNEYFALLRAYDVVSNLKKKYRINENNIKIFVEEFSEIGAKYRRCDLAITVENAFLKEYQELNTQVSHLI